MSDFTRLEDKLAKLRGRERAPGEERRLKGGGAEALIAAILSEIDETILPRRLTFTAESGAALHLAAASRKVQALLAPAPEIEGAKALEGKGLADAGDAEVAALRGVLTRFFETADSVTIASVRPARVFPSDVGVPAALLARAWSVEVADEGPADPDEILSGFLGALGGDAEAWLRIEGENVTGQGGDPIRVEALGEQAAIFLDGYFARFDTIFPGEGGPVATLVAPAGDAGTAAMFVEIGGLSAFVAVKPGRAGAVAGLWQKFTAV